MKTKHGSAIGVAVLAGTLAGYYLVKRQPQEPLPSDPQSSLSSRNRVSKVNQPATAATGGFTFVPITYLTAPSSVGKDGVLIPRPALSELTNPKFARTEAISILQKYLTHESKSVRAEASRLLLVLGSLDGVAELKRVVAAAGAADDQDGLLAVQAAETLQRFGELCAAKDLMAAYQSTGQVGLLRTMALQGEPEVAAIVADHRKGEKSGLGTEWLAAYAGLQDSDSVAQFKAMRNGRSDIRLMADWALFQATGDLRYFDELIAAAATVVDTGPAEETGWTHDDGLKALRYLQISVTPQSTKLLRDISEKAALSSNGNTLLFGSSFSALYFTHRDRDFVFRRVADFLDGTWVGPGIDSDLMYRIAAEASRPEFAERVRMNNTQAFEMYFVRLRGRPVESWIYKYIGDLPSRFLR